MIYYIASPVYQQVITNAVQDSGDVVMGCQSADNVDLLKFIRTEGVKLLGTDKLIIDLHALSNVDEEVISAIKEYRCLDTDNATRIIIVASGRVPGDLLLKSLFHSGILNIVCADDYLIILNELATCLSQSGKSYKDAIVFDTNSSSVTVTRKEIRKVVNKVVVGIAGSQHRIGTTHTAIVLANWLRTKGYMVAVVEANSNDTLLTVQEGFGESLIGSTYKYFTMDGVDFYPGFTEQADMLADVVAKNYNFILADFGVYPDADLVTYNKSDVKLIVCGSKTWETEAINSVFERTSEEAMKDMHFLFNFCPKNPETRKDIKNSMPGQNTHFLEVTDDPFDSKSILPDAETLFGHWMPETAPKKKGFFGRRK